MSAPNVTGGVDTDYRADFTDFVKTKLAAFYDGIKPFYQQRGGNPDSLTYFVNHWPRFEAMVRLCNAHGIDPATVADACELGSWYPYTTFYWKRQNPSCRIDLYDIIVRELGGLVSEYDVDGVRLYDFNLCTDPMPDKQYDMVIVSEVLEHLPCNIFGLCERIVQVVKPGGYLIVTYPLGGINARNYGADLTQYDHGKLVEGHLREFTRATVPLFFKTLETVGTVDVRYPAYGLIQICLYRR